MEQLVLYECLPAIQANRDTNTVIPKSLTIPFDFYLQGWGWHSNEFAGRFFRWMGNEGTAQVRFLIDRSVTLVMELSIHVSLDRALEDEVSLTCDGVRLSPTRIVSSTGPLIRAEIPPSTSGASPHLSVLTIAVPRTIKVPSDGRNLSIAFNSLKIEPIAWRESGRSSTPKALVSDFFPVFAATLNRLSLRGREAALSLGIGRVSVQSCQPQDERSSSIGLDVEVSQFLGLQGRFQLRCWSKLDDSDAAPTIEMRIDGFQGNLINLLAGMNTAAAIDVMLCRQLDHPDSSAITFAKANTWADLFGFVVAHDLVRLLSAAETDESTTQCLDLWRSRAALVFARVGMADPSSSTATDDRPGALQVLRLGL